MDYSKVVIIDEHDIPQSIEEKYSAHENPSKLHRAISIIIRNDKDEILIQKRADSKRTWPGFYSNSVCSHPIPGESYEAAAYRRTYEELGIFLLELNQIYKHTYEFKYDEKYGEHELTYVFEGKYNEKEIRFNPNEVSEILWVPLKELKYFISEHKDNITPWFLKILDDTNYLEF